MSVLAPKEEDIQKMLAAQCHIGTRNSDHMMEEYIWRRRQDGVHIINIGKTWEKLMLAARVLTAIENPQDVIAISARPYGQRAVLKFAQYTGAASIAGRFTPGTFTNQITKQFRECQKTMNFLGGYSCIFFSVIPLPSSQFLEF